MIFPASACVFLSRRTKKLPNGSKACRELYFSGNIKRPFRRTGVSACQKSILLWSVNNTRGSAHKPAFAVQMHKKSGQVPDFLYFEREKVSIQELFLVRVWRSPNTDCRKTKFFDSLTPVPKNGRFFVQKRETYLLSTSAMCSMSISSLLE